MQQPSARHRGARVLAVFAVLAAAVLAPAATPPTFAQAGDSIDLEDAREKAADLVRAKANRGISPDRVVVVYARATGVDDPERARVRQLAGGRLLTADRVLARDVIRVPNGAAAAVAQALRLVPGVSDAYPDAVAQADLAVNDPLVGQQWGLAKIQAPTAWDTTQGAGVKVAVLDCGIRTSHPDLSGKVVLERNFTASATADDRCNHGTHVAGTIAAATNNGVGVASVAPGAQLLNGKVLDDSGSGYFSDVDTAIRWAADNGARVINMSLGGALRCPTGTQAAANYAWSKGVVLVAAAGNSGARGAQAPANCQNVIGVAATNSSDTKASWSNYGPEVDVAAPGVSILSTVNPDLNNGSQYASFSGTSMATPHTAGVAALIWSSSYGASAAAVRDRLFQTADPVSGTGSLWTYGRINAAKAVGPTASATRDVAVASVSLSSTSVSRGSRLTIRVTVANEGTLAESFTVVLADTPPGASSSAEIGRQTVSGLAPGASRTLTFRWRPTRATPTGTHTLTATASAVPDETDTADNVRSATVTVG